MSDDNPLQQQVDACVDAGLVAAHDAHARYARFPNADVDAAMARAFLGVFPGTATVNQLDAALVNRLRWTAPLAEQGEGEVARG